MGLLRGLGRFRRSVGGGPRRRRGDRRIVVPLELTLLAIAVVAGVSFSMMVETGIGILATALLVGLAALAALVAWAGRR